MQWCSENEQERLNVFRSVTAGQMPYYVRFTNSPLRVGGKVTYITTNQKEKKYQWPNSPPLHSLFLSASSLLAFFLPHFATPRLSLSFLRQWLGELSPLIQMREVVCMKDSCFLFIFLHPCVAACLYVCILSMWLYGQYCKNGMVDKRGAGKVIQPTCY